MFRRNSGVVYHDVRLNQLFFIPAEEFCKWWDDPSVDQLTHTSEALNGKSRNWASQWQVGFRQFVVPVELQHE